MKPLNRLHKQLTFYASLMGQQLLLWKTYFLNWKKLVQKVLTSSHPHMIRPSMSFNVIFFYVNVVLSYLTYNVSKSSMISCFVHIGLYLNQCKQEVNLSPPKKPFEITSCFGRRKWSIWKPIILKMGENGLLKLGQDVTIILRWAITSLGFYNREYVFYIPIPFEWCLVLSS